MTFVFLAIKSLLNSICYRFIIELSTSLLWLTTIIKEQNLTSCACEYSRMYLLIGSSVERASIASGQLNRVDVCG